MSPPKAFISHASEDKARFVMSFAQRLRENGIEAWLDRWEIRLGDSLVEKIFEEGIRGADVFVVVLSTISVNKPWVREELDSGVVTRIQKSCRLIPVVIEECEVPQALKHIRWIKIQDLNSYEHEMTEIVREIHGASDKPGIGEKPHYLKQTVVDYLPGLTPLDNRVFRELALLHLESGQLLIRVHPVLDKLKAEGASEIDINESLEVLDRRSHIRAERALGAGIFAARLQMHSLDHFLRSEVPDYEQVFISLISYIVNNSKLANTELHEASKVPVPIINHFLNVLESRGLVSLSKAIGGYVWISDVSPELKRMLR